MKKLFIFIFAVLSIIRLNATEVKYSDLNTEKYLRENNIDGNTLVDISVISNINVSMAVDYVIVHPELRAEIENRLIEFKNNVFPSKKIYSEFPTYADICADKCFVGYPELISEIKTNKCASSDLSDEVYFRNAGCYSLGWDLIKNRLSKVAPKIIKRYLRSQGKSFVTRTLDDGTEYNPMKVPMDEFNVCLNSARFAGMNEWFERYGSNLRLVIDTSISDNELNQLKEDILFGEYDLRPNINKLIRNMSVDDYNAFIKEYNEGTSK